MQKYLYNLATDRDRGFIAAIIKVVLLAFSFIYALAIRIISGLYLLKPHRLNCKVISVGNITLGGTGKTSLVEFIVRYLKTQGHKVAVLTRGYKRKNPKFNPSTTLRIDGERSRTINPSTSLRIDGERSRTIKIPNPNYETMGDEPYVLQMNLKDTPVVVDVDRIRAAKRALSDDGVDTLILDDGFQQWRMKKDLDIVTIDVTNPFGNRHLIPRGILREPLSALKRADIFVLTKTNLMPDAQEIKDFLSRLNPSAAIFESIHKPVGLYSIDQTDKLLNPDTLKGKSVTLLCGIADPDSFENLLTGLGINIGLTFKFPDHYSYTQKDLDKVVKESEQKNIDTIITTEKDAVRLHQLSVVSCQLSVLVLRIELVITQDEQAFANRLLRLYFA